MKTVWTKTGRLRMVALGTRTEGGRTFPIRAILTRSPKRDGLSWRGICIEIDVDGHAPLKDPAWALSLGGGCAGSLADMRRAAESVMSGAASPWRLRTKGGRVWYRFGPDGMLYLAVKRRYAPGWVAGSGSMSCPDEDFDTPAAARAYCDKAIGGAA